MWSDQPGRVAQNAPPSPSIADIEDAVRIVSEHLTPTPQIAWPLLARRTGCEVWVKHENHTPIGAFKVRGGLVYMHRLRRHAPDLAGVITATRGNHGQSVAFAARRSAMKAVVVVPRGNNPEKNAAMQAFGAELVVHGHDFQESYEYAASLAAERRLHMIRAFDPDLLLGVATYGYELFRAVPDIDTVYVPIGQGSGICSLIAVRDALGLDTHIVGVVSENAAAYALSFAAGRAIATESADTIADGMACRVTDPAALSVILGGAERIVTVSDEDVLSAMAAYFVDTHNVAEGAGAAPLAALLNEREAMAGKRVALVLSGGNADQALFTRALNRGVKPAAEA